MRFWLLIGHYLVKISAWARNFPNICKTKTVANKEDGFL